LGPADVQDLIRVLRLSANFGDQLDTSVRDLYAQLWREAQMTDGFKEEKK